jgi:hypothetical protein
MLMNKLVVEKRFDDAVNVFDAFLKKRLEALQTDNKTGQIFTHINLVTEALLNKVGRALLSCLNPQQF